MGLHFPSEITRDHKQQILFLNMRLTRMKRLDETRRLGLDACCSHVRFVIETMRCADSRRVCARRASSCRW